MGLWKLRWKFMTKLPKIVRNTYNAIYHSVYGGILLGVYGFRVRVSALNLVCSSVCPSICPISYWLEDCRMCDWTEGRKGGEFSLTLTLGEHIGNLRTHWALERNIEGTKEKWKKSSPHPPVEGRNLGKGGRGGMRNGGCGNSRILKTPIKIGHLLGV